MAAEVTILDHDLVRRACSLIAQRHQHERIGGVLGVPRGGTPIALAVATILGVRCVDAMQARKDTLVVDDIVDSGNTLAPYALEGYCVDAAFRSERAPAELAPDAIEMAGWLVFPWEGETSAGPEDAVVRLLEFVGEDPTREGLLDTPARVLRSFRELTSGYTVTADEALATVFAEKHDEMVVLDGIRFTSLCEHHLLPFVGTAVVGYVPDGRIVGLSKLARLVEMHARRLQVQERMTEDVARDLMDVLRPRGAGVVVRAHHACMGCRGVRQPDAQMTTSALLGVMRTDAEARAEFLAFARP